MAARRLTADIHTIQVWPRGASITYRGDWAGEALQVRGTAKRWRRATAEERRQIRTEERARLYANNYILRNQCGLISDLIQLEASGARGELIEAFAYDEIRNRYKDPSDWDAAQCREYASDQGVDLPDLPPCPTCDGDKPEDGTTCGTCAGTGTAPDDDASRGGWLAEARDACHAHAQENPAEVYEWYLVDAWLCARLHEIGEVTIDNGYGEWWGRTCTGQALIMDGTLQQIAARYEAE